MANSRLFPLFSGVSLRMVLLETRLLGKTFYQKACGQVRAVSDVSLAIEDGSLTVLRGPSGSGKTTLLSLLGALDRPSAGDVLFEGRNLASCSDTELARVRQRIGFVFQNFGLLPKLSAIECIAYPLIPRGIERSVRRERADSLLERLGIAHCRDAPTEQLSGGERQRIAVARALIAAPQLLLADEPTSNLDPESEELLVATLLNLQATGTTIVVATHDARFSELATNVFTMCRGRLDSVGI